jgi:hypothetical protein
MGGNLRDIGFGNDFLDTTLKAQAIREKETIELHENFSKLYIERYYQHSKNTTHRMGKYIYIHIYI